MYDVECGMALEPMQGNWSSFQVDFGYTELFHIPAMTSVSFQTCDSVLRTLWSSIKQIKAPYVFDWEHGIAVHTMQRNRASSGGQGEVSCFFSSCGGNLGYIIELAGMILQSLCFFTDVMTSV